MDEHAVRCLLADIAETPEPLTTRIDVEAARRAGRGQWIRRAVAPAMTVVALLAVCMQVTVLHDLSPGARPARPAAASQPSAQRERPSSAAPATFNPLAPYADFGSLPRGFSEQSGPPLKGGMSTSLTTVVRTASQQSTGQELVLTVSSGNACHGVVVHSGKVPPAPQASATCALSGYTVSGKATAVSGRPAYWVDGETLAWEYAPGGWAVLSPQAGGLGLKQAIAASPKITVRKGLVIASSAATRTLLEKVAGQVKFAQERALVFPFRYGGEMPRGLRVTSATFYSSGRSLIGTSISVGQASGTSALWISASRPGASECIVEAGDSVVRDLGLPWVKQVQHYGSSGTEESLCSIMPSSLTADLSVSMSADGDRFSADAVLAQLTFLGTNPAKWTARPFP